MTVTLRRPVGVMLALRADDLVDLELHQLMHDAEPNADAEREQALPRCPDELAERLLNLRWERTLRCLQGRDDLGGRYLLHGGSPVLADLLGACHARNASGRGGRTAIKVLRDLGQPRRRCAAGHDSK